MESLDEAIQAVAAGAARLEVCGCLSEAGTTPSIGLVEAIAERVVVPAFVMIRPRGGNFVFGDDDLDVMRRDIDAAKRVGAAGIVSGALDAIGAVDRDTTRRLVEWAAPLPFTFHRAIDLTPDLERSLDVLRSIGVSRLLTSGGASSALVGADAIARLVRRAGDAMTIVAGGSVRVTHVAELLQRTGVTEVHARPVRARPVASATARDVRFGVSLLPANRSELDPEQVRALASALAAILLN